MLLCIFYIGVVILKKTKYLLALILMPTILMLIGELYSVYIMTSQYSFSSINIIFPEQETANEKIELVQTIASQNNLQIFLVNEKVHDDTLTNKTIYASESIKTVLVDKFKLSEGLKKSVFFGNTEIKYQQVNEFQSINNTTDVFLVGEDADINNFTNDFKENFLTFSPGGLSNNNRIYLYVLWSIIFIVLILLTFFEIALSKKENCVKFVFGESVKYIIIKNIAIDFFVFFFIFVGSILVISLFSNSLYFLDVSSSMFILFVILNSLAFLTYSVIDIKKSLSSKKTGRITLKICYIYKFGTVMLCVGILVFCFSSIKTLLNYNNHQDFFKNLNSYDMLIMCPKIDTTISDYHQSIEKLMEVDQELASKEYLKCLSENRTQAYVNLGQKEIYNGTEWIFCDAGSVNYIKEKIPEYKNFNFENKIYFIAPKKFLNKFEFEEILFLYSAYDKSNWKTNYETSEYRSNVELISFNNSDKLKVYFEKNPVIIFDNRNANQIDYPRDIFLCRATFMDVTKQQWNEISNNNQLNLNQTYLNSVNQNYQYELSKATNVGTFSLLLIFIVILIETLIIKSLVQYEFVVNGMELVVKKILGYRLISKYKKLFLLTILSELTILIILTLCFFNSSFLFYIFLSVGVFLLIDFFIIFQYIIKMERINMQKVLKGALI